MDTSYSKVKEYCEEKGVTLVAISKTKTPEELLAVYNQGQRIFGENKVQELAGKRESPVLASKEIEWHLVGHLQSNKVKLIVPFVSLIHAIDSWKLLKEVNKEAHKANRLVNVLLQIHIAREETKFGLSYEEAEKILGNTELSLLANVRILGLMGIASLTEDMEQVRNEFRELKRFFDQFQGTSSRLQTLSMGMSGDYEIAIEEGSTMVRIGSAIFGERNYNR